MVPHGQIIRLKPGTEEAYIILHKNTFPGVLDRIVKSNLSNYSIFLHEGTLFGYYEYAGNDYDSDLRTIADDPVTQQWWKLTAPMQDPLPDRRGDDWWSEMDLIFNYNDPVIAQAKNTWRNAFAIDLIAQPVHDDILNILAGKILKPYEPGKIMAFRRLEKLFIYMETGLEMKESGIPGILNEIPQFAGPAALMREVFHTDGFRPEEKKKKVMVTGCFDMLHSGHIEFLREASEFGDLYVCIGSDANIYRLKGRPTVNTQEERKYMLNAVKYVHECVVNKGWGIMDFLEEIDQIKPDVFIVNEDGNSPAKAELCAGLGIDYRVLQRTPYSGLPARSTTLLRSECHIPFRIDLAGGWLDQPFVSRHFPGPVLTISIEPTVEFNDRSGMASSTRRKAIELWNTDIPVGNPERLAKVLFSYDNPPGTKDVSGSQDALGIVLPGLNRLNYHAHYWPESIDSVNDEDILSWLEDRLHLLTLGPRQSDYDVISNKDITLEKARALALAAEKCWDSILEKDIRAFGKAFRESFEAQIALFPSMVDTSILKVLEQFRDRAYGWKLSGAGGGGYLILVSDEPIEGTIKIRIRRNTVL